MSGELNGKKIAMLIGFREFRDEEYFIPKKILESAGVRITTVSDSLGTAIGKLGGEAEINILLENLKVEDYDAVLFIGGPGAGKYVDNETAHQIVRETIEKDKVLAKAGVLEGKKATVWSSVMDKSAVKVLKEAGAVYQESPVVVDGKIVTASGPLAAKKFAEAVINILKI